MSTVQPETLDAVLQALHQLLPPGRDREKAHIEGPLAGGYSHANFRVRLGHKRYALRLGGPATRDDREGEVDLLRRLPPGVGAELIAADTATGNLLTAWIDAPLLAETRASDSALVRYLVTLHDALPPVSRAHDLAARISAWLSGRRHAPVVMNAFARLQPPRITVTAHNDLNPWNVLCPVTGWRTLDWEWVGTNDPLFDLVTLAAGTGRDAAAIATMARSYLRLRGLDAARLAPVESLLRAFWLREYAWADDALRRGLDREEIVRQRDNALACLPDS
ncbi:MAG: phosphotransferase [Pseudomonadales bacterium]